MNISDINLKNADNRSVKNLYSVPGIAILEKSGITHKTKKENNEFFACILEGVRQYSISKFNMSISLSRFKMKVLNYYKIRKRKQGITKNITFNNNQLHILSTIYNELCKVNDKNNYIGQLIEYAYLKVVRKYESVNEIGHEPYIYYKRTNLHGNANFSRRLLDFVVIENRKVITLCECKANLQREFKFLCLNKNLKFFQKLQLMDFLKNKLIQCQLNSSSEFITVNRVLVTAFLPTNQHSLRNKSHRNIDILTIRDLVQLI
ncbi:pathogenicity island protein [Staphylococcus haemolyticus]